jgi:hypothetical protein
MFAHIAGVTVSYKHILKEGFFCLFDCEQRLLSAITDFFMGTHSPISAVLRNQCLPSFCLRTHILPSCCHAHMREARNRSGSSVITRFPVLKTNVLVSQEVRMVKKFAVFYETWRSLGRLWTGCWGEYLDQEEMKWQEIGEGCITRNFILRYRKINARAILEKTERSPYVPPLNILQQINSWKK